LSIEGNGGIMIIFSPRKLEQQLINGTITAWEKAKYLVLAVVVSALAGPLFWVTPTVKEQHLGVTTLVQLLTTIVGLYITYKGIRKCYNTNNHEDKFIERFICLRVPWTVIFATVLAPLSITIIATAKKAFPEIPDLSSLIIYFCSPVITYLYYYALNNSFIRISTEQSKASTTLG
jgi:hypothetical protein